VVDEGVEIAGLHSVRRGLGRVRKCVLGFLRVWGRADMVGVSDGDFLRDSVRGFGAGEGVAGFLVVVWCAFQNGLINIYGPCHCSAMTQLFCGHLIECWVLRQLNGLNSGKGSPLNTSSALMSSLTSIGCTSLLDIIRVKL